jgi:hypothetical protein
MILVAVVAVQLSLARLCIQMFGREAVQGPFYIVALLFAPGIVRGLTQGPKRRESHNEGAS